MSRLKGPGSETQASEWPASPQRDRGILVMRLPGVLLGLGLGGFFDGILFHQILQWHHMLSSVHPTKTVAGLELNTLADGLFHASTWIFVVVGLLLLWRAVRSGAKGEAIPSLFGWVLLGWGGFNLAEGLVDHHLLQVHHVRPGPHQTAWDLGFLASGAFLVWIGQALTSSAETTRFGQ